MPISDSFWLYDHPGIPNSAFSYFKNYATAESRFAPQMRELIKAGILDVMHGYGNFANPEDFQRDLAKRGMDELDRHNLKIKVWTNHGGIESQQNIGARSVGAGDIKKAGQNNFYHTDLLTQFGVNFYWDCELSSLMSAVGQDRDAKYADFYWKSPLNYNSKLKAKSGLKSLITIADNIYSKFSKRHFMPWEPFDRTNRLIHLDQLRDGNQLFLFKRFGNARLDWSEDFPILLNNSVLETLLSKKGYLILYIHLGDRKSCDARKPLSKLTIEKFSQLAELSVLQKVWINTTSRLLTYNLVHRFLQWSVEEHNNLYKIVINGLALSTGESNLYLNELNGLSFQLPAGRDVKIFLKDNEVHIKKFILNDQKNQVVVIPTISTEWPL